LWYLQLQLQAAAAALAAAAAATIQNEIKGKDIVQP